MFFQRIMGFAARVVIFAGVCSICVASFAGMVDKVVAVVNDEVITQREFDRAFAPLAKKFEERFKGEELEKRKEEAKKFLLEQIINSKLAISLAKKKKLQIDETEFGDRIKDIRSFYSSEEEFLRELNSKGTNLTEFEQEVKDHMLAQKLIESEISSKITISPSEIQDVYEKNRDKLVSPAGINVRSIMVRKREGSDGIEEKAKIKELLAEVKAGGNFAETAASRSEGPFAENGGDMGFMVKGQLTEEIEKVVFALKKGQISEVVESTIGYHIFLVEDVKESAPLALDETSDFIRDRIFQRKIQEETVEWVEEQRKKAYISYK